MVEAARAARQEGDWYAALGVTEVQLVPDRHPVEFVEQIADRVLPRAATIGA